MTRPGFGRAAVAALVALSVAAGVNAVLYLVAGEAVRIPGELTIVHVVTFTLAMAIPTAVVLALWPRLFKPLVIVAALASLPFPFLEFEPRTAAWLAPMHIIA